ncbi:MAG TPA: hypothetical protein VE545_08250 [Candidatus Dormibacteraeota bacterium]|jgi:hypothetical protein|nr:hypothetical protein [Candidatus Dormibacteraeota bacterium]
MSSFRRISVVLAAIVATLVSSECSRSSEKHPSKPWSSAHTPAAIPLPAGTTQPLDELQQRFDREGNAVHKAKLITKLGDAQFAALHAAESAEDYAAVGTIMEKYRDNIRAAFAALQKEHPDAVRNSSGYRELQIHTRRGIGEVADAIRSAPDEFKPPLELVRKDLVAMNDKMLELLFPSPNLKQDK